MNPVPLKKITVADVYAYGKPEGEGKLKVPKDFTLLLYIYGAVSSAVVKPSKFDESQELLIGRFEAVRVADGQTFTSERLYLPDNDYQKQLAKAAKPDENGEIKGEVEFGFMIGYRAGASPTGYVFTCEPMTDTRTQDRLASVRKLLQSSDILKKYNLPALAAPDKKK